VSDAALLPTLALLVMSAVHAGLPPRYLRTPPAFLILSLVLAAMSVWGEQQYYADLDVHQNRSNSCVAVSKDSVCFQVRYYPRPVVSDALLPSIVPGLVLELTRISNVTAPWTASRLVVHAAVVAAYWFLLFYAGGRRNGRLFRLIEPARRFILVLLGVMFVVGLLGWTIGGAHGYMGAFGGLIGIALHWIAFFRTRGQRVLTQTATGPSVLE